MNQIAIHRYCYHGVLNILCVYHLLVVVYLIKYIYLINLLFNYYYY